MSLNATVRNLFFALVVSSVFGLGATACSGIPPAGNDDVYQALGQTEGIDRLVQALLDRVYADERIAFLFAETDRENLHKLIVEQICEETGGPCEYTGLPMDEGHSGLQIKHAEFEAFVEDFILAMEDVDVPFTVQNRVLAIFAPMQEDIVYK